MFPSWRLDLVLLLGLLVLAVGLRLPYHQTVPAFTDELRDIYRAFLISGSSAAAVEHIGELRDVYRGVVFVQDQVVPLTGTSAYFGSLWEWLLAAVLWVTGFNIYAPRLLMLALSVLTVLATYPLARAWGGRAGGIIAAGLLTTSGGHILVNSHVAWSACATPLFTTLAVWTLYMTVRCPALKSPKWLLLSGFCWGLALQTHPVVLALLPGALSFLIWSGRPLLRTRWAYLALALFLLANLNLIIYNVAFGFESVTQGLERNASYTGDERLTLSVYGQRLLLLLVMLLRLLGGAVGGSTTPDMAEYLTDPWLWLIAAVAAAGVLWQSSRGNHLPILLLTSATLMLPLFNGRFEGALHFRYLAMLLPILYASAASILAAALAWLSPLSMPYDRESPVGTRFRQVALVVLVICAVLHPLSYLQSYYQGTLRSGRTNAHIFETVEQIRTNQRSNLPVLIDRRLQSSEFREPNAWRLGTIFQVFLAISAIPYRLTDLESDEPLDPDQQCAAQLVIMATHDEKATAAISSKLNLQATEREPTRPGARPTRYGLFSLDRLPSSSATGCRL